MFISTGLSLLTTFLDLGPTSPASFKSVSCLKIRFGSGQMWKMGFKSFLIPKIMLGEFGPWRWKRFFGDIQICFSKLQIYHITFRSHTSSIKNKSYFRLILYVVLASLFGLVDRKVTVSGQRRVIGDIREQKVSQAGSLTSLTLHQIFNEIFSMAKPKNVR